MKATYDLAIIGGGVIQGLPEYVSLVEHIVHLKALDVALEGLRVVKAASGNKGLG